MCFQDIKEPNEPNILLPYEVPKNHKLYSIALGNQTLLAKLYNLFRRDRKYTELVDLLMDNNYFVLPNRFKPPVGNYSNFLRLKGMSSSQATMENLIPEVTSSYNRAEAYQMYGFTKKEINTLIDMEDNSTKCQFILKNTVYATMYLIIYDLGFRHPLNPDHIKFSEKLALLSPQSTLQELLKLYLELITSGVETEFRIKYEYENNH